MNKFFMGLFTVLTVFAGMATTGTHLVSKGDTTDNLAHTAAQASMARSIRNGSVGYYSTGGYSRSGSSGGSYRGGK